MSKLAHNITFDYFSCRVSNLFHLCHLSSQFYSFVHKIFPNVVTKDQAMKMKLENIMDENLLTNRFGSIDCAHLQRIWLRVVEGVNAFLSANNSVVNWNCEEVDIPFHDVQNCRSFQY